ncbi:MAG: ABC transporter ATP-binding protein [Acidobacteriota bacterium]
MSSDGTVRFDGVSKFYGEVLGVNHISLRLEPGITSLVGPNGSGKSTLMNLMAGLLRPSRGEIRVLGIPTDRPEELFRVMGYATQYEGFARGITGRRQLISILKIHGLDGPAAAERAEQVLARVGLTRAADRKIAGYSKGMRQRIKLAQAICHRPAVLLLDEPLNGLDPMARAEMIELFKGQAEEGMHVIISSHILHEVDMISDRVVLLNAGYVVAKGEIEGVREEVEEQPLQVWVRCDRPARLAARILEQEHVTEIKIHEDRGGLMVRTKDADGLYLDLNRVVLEEGFAIEGVAPSDSDVAAVYDYLIGPGQGGGQ